MVAAETATEPTIQVKQGKAKRGKGKQVKIKQVKGMKGYYKFPGTDTSRIYISRKNKKNQKHGECFEYEGGNLKRVCEYNSDVLVCVKMEFHGETMVEKDNGTIVYEGGYRGSIVSGFWRDGKGVEYDKNGNIIYKGEWNNGWKNGIGNETEWCYGYNKSVYMDCMRERGPVDNTKMVINTDYLFKKTMVVLVPPLFSKLKSVSISIDSKDNVSVFDISGLGELETIVITKNCMSLKDEGMERRSKTPHGSFRVVNCGKLKTISIGDYSFSCYQSFEMSNLPSLKSIVIGNNCFGLVDTVTINGFDELKQILIGKGCFTVCLTEDKISKSVVNGALTVSDCRALDTIMVGAYSFSSFESFNVGNLESLNVIGLGDCCFYHAQSFSLESITIG